MVEADAHTQARDDGLQARRHLQGHVELQDPMQRTDGLGVLQQRGAQFFRLHFAADGLEIQAHAADADSVPLSQRVRGGAGWVEGYDGTAAAGADGAECVEHAGIVVAVDGGLHEDHAVDVDGGVEAHGVREGVWCRRVLGIGG